MQDLTCSNQTSSAELFFPEKECLHLDVMLTSVDAINMVFYCNHIIQASYFHHWHSVPMTLLALSYISYIQKIPEEASKHVCCTQINTNKWLKICHDFSINLFPLSKTALMLSVVPCGCRDKLVTALLCPYNVGKPHKSIFQVCIP